MPDSLPWRRDNALASSNAPLRRTLHIPRPKTKITYCIRDFPETHKGNKEPDNCTAALGIEPQGDEEN